MEPEMEPVLADTSVWMAHLFESSHALVGLLRERRVMVHPFVMAELALSNAAGGTAAADAMRDLRPAPWAGHDAVLRLIEAERLQGMGIGLVGAHLLASVLMEPDGMLFTRDARLRAVAERLGVAAQ